MNKMKIDIWSDIACPYCYIGLKKLEQALDQFPHRDEVELVWHSYELSPERPMDTKQVTTENKTKSHSGKIAKLAEEVDLVFNFNTMVTANTSRALRLVKLAATKDLATQMEEALFKAHFSDGEDVSNMATLIAIGKRVGLPESEIAQMLDSDKYSQEIKDDTRYGDEVLDLEYIPYYLFNNEHIVQGSIPTEDYAKVLEQSFDQWKQKGVSQQRGDIISGQSCSIDGVCS